MPAPGKDVPTNVRIPDELKTQMLDLHKLCSAAPRYAGLNLTPVKVAQLALHRGVFCLGEELRGGKTCTTPVTPGT